MAPVHHHWLAGIGYHRLRAPFNLDRGSQGVARADLGPWGGVLADRLNPRKLVMGAQVVMVSSALTFGVLLANGKIDSIWHAYGYMLVSGIAFAFVQPTR